MSRLSHRRLIALPLAAAAAALLTLPGSPTRSAVSAPPVGIPSSAYWAAHPEQDVKVADPNGVYAPNTDEVVLKNLSAASALPHGLVVAWRSAGPFGGVQDLAAYGSGAEQFGPIEGIGTAIAVDTSDATGNTVYFGTHGGLWTRARTAARRCTT